MATNRVAVEPALAAAVAGDLDAFTALVHRHPEPADENAGQSERLVLTPAAARRVLAALRQETASPSTVQQWASFVRRGYVVHADGRQTGPLDIEYGPQEEYESILVEVIARLDELGDAIDGHLSTQEIDALLAGLSKVSSDRHKAARSTHSERPGSA
jgi:hypothetical protein